MPDDDMAARINRLETLLKEAAKLPTLGDEVRLTRVQIREAEKAWGEWQKRVRRALVQ